MTSLEYDGGVDAEGRTIDISADLRGSAAAEALFAENDEDALPAAVLRCLKKCVFFFGSCHAMQAYAFMGTTHTTYTTRTHPSPPTVTDRCPRDLRRGLASHVLVIGGGAMLPGFCRRLAEEVRHGAAAQPRFRELAAALAPSASSGGGGGGGGGGLCVVRDACVLAPRNVLAWAGGSVLAVVEEASSAGSGAGGRVAGGSVGGRGARVGGGEGGGGGSRFVSRSDWVDAEALGGASRLLPEWLTVSAGMDGEGEPN